ncbi:MAG: asparagine synthase B, partial [Nonlabens sp.]|nr:asparagine synthase B [Nonlabens sp.]
MCGIVGVFQLKKDSAEQREAVLALSKKIRHRGPDWSGIYCGEKAILAHERLTIVDPQSGGQPLYSPDGTIVLAVNGEIYNHQKIREQYEGSYDFKTKSDCEVILALYQDKGVNFMDELNGMYGFALYDSKKDVFLCARDHQGIIPLYYGTDELGQFYVASELKALEGTCNEIAQFPPGHYYYSEDNAFTKWYEREWRDYDAVKNNVSSIDDLRTAMEASVHRHLMSDVPYGVLLSGGLDSSLVSAVAKKYAARRVESGDHTEAWWPQLHSFAVGLVGSPDLAAAQKVAKHIGTVHHEVNFTVQEGLDALKDVVYFLETYDVT